MNPVLEPVRAPKPTIRIVQLLTPPSINFREVGYGYRPNSSLGVSVLGHGLIVLCMFLMYRFSPMGHALTPPPPLMANRTDTVLVLPVLGGGSEGSGEEGGGNGAAGKISSGLRAQSKRGFAYPGPQPMVSNPPNATLGVQTILQPSLPNLPRLRQPVELPNIVQPAPPPVVAVEKPIVVKGGQLTTRPVETPVAQPKLALPSANRDQISELIESKPQIPQRAVPDAVEMPKASNLTKKSGLLVVNAVPPAPDVKGNIPHAEERSIFAIAPGEATIIAAPAAGTKSGGEVSTAAGNGGKADVRNGDSLADMAAGGLAGAPTGASGVGAGGHYGSGEGKGLNPTGTGTAAGRGNASGAGSGASTPAGIGSGSGAGTAPGSGGFAGIAIQGGKYGNGSNGNMLVKVPNPRQPTYKMTVESTAGSGGGLPELGIFDNEKVYTVYIDMRASDEDSAPSWTLTYAVLQPTATGSDGEMRSTGTPTPPYATLKQLPQFTPEQLRRCAHTLIVASAVMDTDGKLHQVSVKQSPESQIIAPLIEALRRWTFEPAKLNGTPIALKVAFGIRLGLPH
ncbi:MAG TPA: energy transducer TonB [Terriglobales bacterium]|jgi:hypothetical protein|nr:energy transducer TonB [Terriglobales bacterium]